MELQGKELTPDLWKLYNFIKERTANGQATSVKDVCEHMPDVYYLNEKESNFSNCPKLYKDIDTLNASYQIEKIIIKDNNNFKLATKEEAETYRDKLKARAVKLFKKYWTVFKKIEKDGQGKVISADGTPIDEKSQERAFIESFIQELESEDPEDAR